MILVIIPVKERVLESFLVKERVLESFLVKEWERVLESVLGEGLG